MNLTETRPEIVGTADIRDVDSPLVADESTNKVRGIRLEKDLWDELLPAAAANGYDRAGLIRQFVRWYLRRPGAKLPQRPGGD
jgi:hypothetical protein